MPLRLKASFIIQPFSIFYVPPYKAFFMHLPCLFSLFIKPLSALETERNNEKNNLHSSIKSINFLHVWAAAALLVLLFLLFLPPLLLLANSKTFSYFVFTFLMMLSWCDNVEYLLVSEVAPKIIAEYTHPNVNFKIRGVFVSIHRNLGNNWEKTSKKDTQHNYMKMAKWRPQIVQNMNWWHAACISR